MAPPKPIRRDEPTPRLKKVTDTADKIIQLLRSRESIPATVQRDLQQLVKTGFPIPTSTFTASTCSGLDSLGCNVWNAATNLLREAENNEEPHKHDESNHLRLIALLRCFAFFILDAAFQWSNKPSKEDDDRHDQVIRHFKVGLKACRFCLNADQLDLALKVLEHISSHVSSDVEDTSPLVRMSDGEERQLQIPTPLMLLQTEFYVLRITHAWKSERLDLAEHFYRKVCLNHVTGSVILAEQAADMFYGAGRSLLKRNTEAAITWLKRALHILDFLNIEDRTFDMDELRLTIAATLVEAFLSCDDTSRTSEAQRIADELYTAFGTRLAVQVLKFDVLATEKPADITQLEEILLRMARSIVLTDHNFKILMKKVRQAHEYSREGSCEALKELITARLLPEVSSVNEVLQTWLEKACVTYIFFATSTDHSPATSESVITALATLLDTIAEHGCTLSPKATHAAQTLIWKATASADANIAEQWCVLLRHGLFDGAGQINKAKIGRKSMTLAVARGDMPAARAVFFAMSPSAQNEPISRYIAFKIALRSEDYELARECLGVVAASANRDPKLLYACVLEAQQSSMRPIAVAALQSLIDKRPAGVQFASLLRCTARLLVGELESQDRSKDEVAEEIVRVFETATTNLKTLKQGTDGEWQSEIKWWSKNAYNLSLRLLADVHAEFLVRLLSTCTTFLGQLPDNIQQQEEIVHRRQLCHFLSATASIVLARSSQEGSEPALNAYLRARKEIATYKSLATPPSPANTATSQTLIDRLFELHKFDLECILQLKQWDDLDAGLLSCLDLHDTDRWDTLADLLLIIHQRTSSTANTSTTYILRLLDRIVNDTWKRQKNLPRAARWLRLSFSIALQTLSSPGTGEREGESFALTLLDQAARMAGSKHAQRSDGEDEDKGFPESELQWLATTGFNRAIDLLCVSGPASVVGVVRAEAEKWISAALEVARYARDQGALHANLTGRRERLRERMTMIDGLKCN